MERLTVRFYELDRVRADKGEFVGVAEFAGGEMKIDVTDDILKHILTNPITTINDHGVYPDSKGLFVTVQPGSLSHLRTIASLSATFGYISEIESH